MKAKGEGLDPPDQAAGTCAPGGPAGSHRGPRAVGSARSRGDARLARSDRPSGEQIRGAAGMGLLRCEGEGLAVTRVNAGVLGDGRTVPGTVRRCPGPHPYPMCRLMEMIDHEFVVVKYVPR